MYHSPARTAVAWILVIGVFAGLVVFWIPSISQTVKGLSSAVRSGTQISAQHLSAEWSGTQKQIQDFGTFVKNGPFSQRQWETFAQEVDTHINTEKEAGVFPVHEDVPNAAVKETDPEQAFCTRNAGLYVQRAKDDDTYGVCLFRDGSECEAQSFANATCRAGLYRTAESGMKVAPDVVSKKKK